LIALVKAKVVEEGLDDEESIREVIEEGSNELGITLSEEEVDTIISLMKKISELDLDFDSMKEQAGEMLDKLEELGVDKEEAKNFFQKIIDAITEFFESLFDE